MKHAREKSGRGGIAVLVVLLVILLGIAGALAAHVFLGLGQTPKLAYESNAVVGTANDPAARLAEMQAMVDRSTISLSINASPVWTLSARSAGVNWQIENPAAQSGKLLRVEIVRDDTGETIYTTGAIPPGTYVSDTLPDAELPEGIYACTAYFYSYDMETEEFLGKAGAQITLYVQP